MTASLHVLVLAAPAAASSPRAEPYVPAGRSALHRVVSTAVALAGNAVTVVLGANARQAAPALAGLSVSMVLNRQWDEGPGSSLRIGVAALPAACDAVLILSSDQPRVTVDDLRQLLDAWKHDDATIAAAFHDRQADIPVIFPRLFFGELARLRGDQDARAIIRRNSYRLARVPMPNAAMNVTKDLAVPEERFQHSSTDE
ncbi:4-diphosphocytidyl-2C-methyl-D-erythritol synthase [Steroidobacter denitrificans]|uniref:4-diphosphocytidyl-2C-methyl-D-erythritol synthase n=1 Tax=Steroidobacter denitrificans TaxID=465721 RepID=A0A127FDC0_STEDE|nr:nucleotidyltransferase family protein [Steroidobacter denitrificans]AMN48383.1 4-diphosphocytidyl-2C-methyl-D-erythritol synthase [Steroidobacter denitrificans]